MDVVKKTEYQYMPFIVKELEDKVGGLSVALQDLRKDVDHVPPGAYIGEDENGLGHIIRGAVVTELVGADANTMKVSKTNQVKTGDYLTSFDVEGVKAYKITSVDTSNTEYDMVTVGTALGQPLPIGTSLVVVGAEDAVGGASKLPYKDIGITKREIDTTGSHASVGVLMKGTVNVANLAYGAPKVLRDANIHITYQE